MSSDEDDYLSDKFLAAVTPTSAAPKTYRDLRRQAARRAEEKNAANRTKSTREREREAREEGLSKTLFERAAEETSGSGSSKALQMMMRMGFQPGKALGGAGDDNEKRPDSTKTEASSVQDQEVEEPSAEPSMPRSKGPLVNPLPLNDWTGKQGIGVNKRAAEALERAAKVKRVTEEQDASSYRERARGEFELRRAEARLEPAQRTCIQLDERQGVQFNTLWLSSKDPSAFPDGLWRRVVHFLPTPNTSHEEQLRRQMRQDALQPLGETLDDVGRAAQKEKEVDPAVVEDAIRFLQLDSVDRLSRVLEYLRERYQYCFWCGTEYADEDDFAKNCPGPDEDMHD